MARLQVLPVSACALCLLDGRQERLHEQRASRSRLGIRLYQGGDDVPGRVAGGRTHITYVCSLLRAVDPPTKQNVHVLPYVPPERTVRPSSERRRIALGA